MGDSIDSFWLLLTLQHGLFAFLLVLAACLYAVFSTLNRINQQPDSVRWMVTAWLLSFMSLILIGFTVDYFGKLQPLFFFMLGAIGWARYTLDPDYPLVASEPERTAAEPAASLPTNKGNRHAAKIRQPQRFFVDHSFPA
ncbi:MAG: hypothetical protein R3E89_02815 [Thiolinea sp.]